MSTPVKRQIRRRKLSKRRPQNGSADLGKWGSSSMPELPSFHSRYSTDSLFSWHSWPIRVPTPPLTFDGSDWYADDVFPRPTTLHDRFRFEQLTASFPVETKAPRTTEIRPIERPSLTLPRTHYPRRSSPLTSPPDPPDPEPNVPVPFDPSKSNQSPAKPSPNTELKRTLSTCSKLKKKRRETADEESYATMLGSSPFLIAIPPSILTLWGSPTPDRGPLHEDDPNIGRRARHAQYAASAPLLRRKANARGTVILFHGNAMNHGDILPYAKLLYHKNFNVFTLEYRGYGLNKGTPSEWGLQRDGQAAVDYVLSHPELSKLPLIIYGQSLGGAIAIHATYKNSDKVAALIIENTFTSIPDIIKDIPVIRHISFLCTQRWQSAKKVARLPPKLPILMLAGLQDQVIPYSHTEKLWEVSESRGRPKPKKSRWKWKGLWRKGAAATEEDSGEEDGKGVPLAKNKHRFFPGGSHNDTYTKSRYWQTVYEFLDDVFAPQR
ncbi:hypothetical protein CVT26_010576 [Gymnopilus dilepis]|uniref:Serine aminopeptidase S33 domain-containing protein n=1 Tax=Gymnopilus dilepis TaxID=231916 RepID=A0A409VZG4_9AGAR|nr:hypothetical protein CVT26_010576 [Gymnopilus dilepis]